MSSSSSSPISHNKSPVSINSGASQVANLSCNRSSPQCTNAITSSAPTTVAASASSAGAPVTSTISVYRSARSALSSAVPMKLFAAWEVEKTPSNCIPRLCTLTLSKLSLTRRFASQVHSVAIAAKMRSSKRTLRSHEIDLSHYLQSAKVDSKEKVSGNLTRNISSDQTTIVNNTHSKDVECEKDSIENCPPRSPADHSGCNISKNYHHQQQQRSIQLVSRSSATADDTHSSNLLHGTYNRVTDDTSSINDGDDYISIDLDLTFALQYPHFLKKNDNQLQIVLQRRKRYKNRAMLGFKTLAGGIVDLTEVLQRSQLVNKELQLYTNTKHSPSNESIVAAKLIITSLKSTPVDACDGNSTTTHIRQVCAVTRPPARSFKSYSSRLKRLNLKDWSSSSHRNDASTVFHLNDSGELDSDEEVCDDFSLSGESDSEVTIDTVARAMMSHVDYNRRISLKNQPEVNVINEPCVTEAPCSSWSHHDTSDFNASRLPNGMKWIRSTDKSSPIHQPGHHFSIQRNFKQRFFSLLKMFKITDSEASDSEEGENRGKVTSKRGKNCEATSPDCLPLDRIDDLESDLEDTDDSFDGDLDDLSICSTARPGLKPFFSSKSTLVEDNAFADTTIISDSFVATQSLEKSAAAAATSRSTHPSSSKSATNSTSSHG